MNIRHRYRGFSLVELMIAMAIALVVLLAVSQAYVASLENKRANIDLTRVNETARFAFGLIERELHKAGYTNTWARNNGSSTSSGDFCNPAVTALVGANDVATLDPANAALGAGAVTVLNGSDVVSVRFYGEDDTLGVGADGSVLDCHGYPVRRGELVREVLYVANEAATGEPALYCHTQNDTTGVSRGSLPLVTGVESLQLLYGEDTDGDGVINRYIPWDNTVQAGRVNSLRVSLVARSPNATSTDTAFQTYTHFGSGPTFTPTTGAGRVRMMLPMEIALRNYGSC